MEVWIVDLTIKFPKNYQFGASFVNDLQQTSVRASFLRLTKKLPDTLSDFTSVRSQYCFTLTHIPTM